MKGICNICGKEGAVDNHHIDYNKKIIIPVCRTCHKKLHSLQRMFYGVRKTPVKLKCQRCDHIWTYKGKSPLFATCPSCLIKVSINKEEQKEEKNDL